MSLDWNLTEIEDHTNRCWTGEGDERRLAGTTECLIFATMFVGLGRITASNAKTFYSRLYQWERIAGCLRSDNQPMEYNDVVRHIGLRTNVSNETDAAFRKKLQRAANEAAARSIRLAEKE